MGDKNDINTNLPHPVFDSHFHALHMSEKGLDIKTLLSDLFGSGLAGAMEVAVDEYNFEERLKLSELFPGLRFSAGIHPSSTSTEHEKWKQRFQIICSQVEHPLVKAIGETGLDFYRDYAPVERQVAAFRDHLNLSAETGLPIIIHSRSADAQVLEIIRASGCRHGIFHCFSSGWDVASQALDLGFHISFAGNITYKNTENIRQAALRIPRNRLLIETDSPYLSPQRVRGRTNHPGHIGYTLAFLAKLRDEKIEEIASYTLENSKQLFM